MSNIRVGETRRPETSKRKAGTKRQKRQRDAAKVLADRKNEPIPRNTVVARVGITLSHVSPSVLRECPHCEHENWKWLDRCALCKRDVPDE
jgi:hypothetical protein